MRKMHHEAEINFNTSQEFIIRGCFEVKTSRKSNRDPEKTISLSMKNHHISPRVANRSSLD